MNFNVSIEPDQDGYTGRECPECEKYFKIKFGTGLPGEVDCHCPYCNNIGPHDHYWTQNQIEYAKSVALNKVTNDLLRSLKKLEIKPKRNQLISIGITVKGRPTPIIWYCEDKLEENVCCDNCTLEYSIYGTFGHCPDCGEHNSKQIVNKNFNIALKIIELASEEEAEIVEKLIENSLEDAISAFDGFGREHCSGIYEKISFQNIGRAKTKLLEDHSIDISENLSPEDWSFVIEQFQKRHLLAHRMGIIDEEFVEKTGWSSEMIGRKIPISAEEVRNLIDHLRKIVENIYNSVSRS